MHTSKTPVLSESASSLAAQPQVAAFVYQMLTIAQAGGMPESRVEELYEEIMKCYSLLDASAFETFRNEFLKILNCKGSH